MDMEIAGLLQLHLHGEQSKLEEEEEIASLLKQLQHCVIEISMAIYNSPRH